MRPKSSRITPSNLTRKHRGLIRGLNRSFARDDKSPQVVRKTAQPAEPTVCARCGAIYVRKTWSRSHKLTDEMLEQRHWGFCPACQQVSHLEAQGKLVIRGDGVGAQESLIRSRIENVAQQAARQQPERRIVSIDTIGSDGGLEVLTTSQKLAHRLAHELKKTLHGRASYSWSDDGTLFATVEVSQPKPKTKKAG